MSEVTIQLRPGPPGERRIVVRLRSDCDLMPHEHEQLHRRVVEQLLEGGILGRCDERIHVERERPAKEPALG